MLTFKNPTLLSSSPLKSSPDFVLISLKWNQTEKMKAATPPELPRNPLACYVPKIKISSVHILCRAMEDFALSLQHEFAKEAINLYPKSADTVTLSEDAFSAEAISAWYVSRKETSDRFTSDNIHAWYYRTLAPAITLAYPDRDMTGPISTNCEVFKSLSSRKLPNNKNLLILENMLAKYADAIFEDAFTIKVVSKISELLNPVAVAEQNAEEI